MLGVSRIAGVGVFAARNFFVGDFIAPGIHADDYTKNFITHEEVLGWSQTIRDMIARFCVGTPTGVVVPADRDFNNLSVKWFMNHSCPDGDNVGFNRKGDFVARRRIHVGDELLYDYALADWNPAFRMPCFCRSSHCREVITGNDWKRLDSKTRKWAHPALFSDRL